MRYPNLAVKLKFKWIARAGFLVVGPYRIFVFLRSLCHPYGVSTPSSVHFPTAPAVGYVVSSLRDFRRMQKLNARVLSVLDCIKMRSRKLKYEKTEVKHRRRKRFGRPSREVCIRTIYLKRELTEEFAKRIFTPRSARCEEPAHLCALLEIQNS